MSKIKNRYGQANYLVNVFVKVSDKELYWVHGGIGKTSMAPGEQRSSRGLVPYGEGQQPQGHE